MCAFFPSDNFAGLHLTFSKAVFSLYIPTGSIPIFGVNIKYFHSLNPISVLGWFCCYQDLTKPMQTEATDKKWVSIGIKIPPETLYRHLPEIPFHKILQKVKGQIVG
jgi:hypothetical protein